MKQILAALLVLPVLAACVPTEPASTGPAVDLQGADLDARLADSRLTLRGEGGDGTTLLMDLTANHAGTVQMSQAGIVVMDLGLRWKVEGNQLCTQALFGASMGASDFDCVSVVISGDQVRLSRQPTTGGTEVFTGTISPL